MFFLGWKWLFSRSYYHDPVPPAKHLKDNFNITIINKIDIADINYSYYNEFADSVLFSKSGKRFTDFYKKIK